MLKMELTTSDKVKMMRKRRGMSQSDMADMLGMVQTNYSAKERGRYKFTIEEIIETCEKLGFDINFVFSNMPLDIADEKSGAAGKVSELIRMVRNIDSADVLDEIYDFVRFKTGREG